MFKKGDKKPEISGRRTGTPNKKTLDARSLAERLKIDPLEILFHFANKDWKALGYEEETTTKVLKDGGTIQIERITAEMRLTAAKEAVRYVYPQTKAVELSTPKPFDSMTPEQKIEALKNALRVLESESDAGKIRDVKPTGD